MKLTEIRQKFLKYFESKTLTNDVKEITNNIIIEDKTVSETNKIDEIIIDFDNDEPVG